MMQPAKVSILLALALFIALVQAQSPPADGAASTDPTAQPDQADSSETTPAGDDSQMEEGGEDGEVTAEDELGELIWEFDMISSDCETLGQMLNKTQSDPEADQADLSEIQYALTGCLDILEAISGDIEALEQEVQEEGGDDAVTSVASTDDSAVTTAATPAVAAN